MLRYFTEHEFAQAKPACSLSDMNESFMSLLDKARDIAGVPFKVNSAYRTFGYELEHGRSGTSSHCKGLAIDIACNSSYRRLVIVSALLRVGFSRIGIHKHFIHVDYDSTKSKAIWLY